MLKVSVLAVMVGVDGHNADVRKTVVGMGHGGDDAGAQVEEAEEDEIDVAMVYGTDTDMKRMGKGDDDDVEDELVDGMLVGGDDDVDRMTTRTMPRLTLTKGVPCLFPQQQTQYLRWCHRQLVPVGEPTVVVVGWGLAPSVEGQLMPSTLTLVLLVLLEVGEDRCMDGDKARGKRMGRDSSAVEVDVEVVLVETDDTVRVHVHVLADADVGIVVVVMDKYGQSPHHHP